MIFMASLTIFTMRYKDLCKYFKEPQKQGGARQSQIEKWKKTHDIEYNNREYKIIRKYTKEEIEHNQMRGKYIKLFSMVLSNLLLQSDKNCVSYSMMESYRDWETDRKSTRLNSSHSAKSRMPSSA